MARHPNTKQLTEWLHGEVNHSDHDTHIDSCSKCASRIEELNMNNVEAISAEFRPALLAVLRPPEDLHERISARIADRLQQQSDTRLFGSLIGIPVETLRILTDIPNAED